MMSDHAFHQLSSPPSNRADVSRTGKMTRRGILGAFGATALTAGIGRAVAADTPNRQGFIDTPPSGLGARPHPDLLRPLGKNMQPLRYAIIGLGKYAINQILPAFAECQHSKVTALVSGSPEKARRIARQYDVGQDHLYTYDNFDKIVHDPEVDAVYIILPNGLHCDMAKRAFAAGKHVMCEKPMAISVEQCQQMIDAGKKAGKYLMIGYRCHFDPLTQKAISLLQEGAIGTRQIVTTDNSDINDPRHDIAQTWRFTPSLSGGGSLMDLGIYGVNGTRYLLDEDPVEIRAFIAPNKDPIFKNIEDTMAWIFSYKSGAVAHGSSSFTVNSATSFRVQGSKANLVMDPATSYWANRVNLRDSGDTHTWSTPMFTIPSLNQFSAQLDYLATCVASQTPPVRASGEEGMQDVRLIMAMYDSARNNKPVSTDWSDWRKA